MLKGAQKPPQEATGAEHIDIQIVGNKMNAGYDPHYIHLFKSSVCHY